MKVIEFNIQILEAPLKGGIRYHQDCDLNEVKALAKRLLCSYIVESANGPSTTAADKVLEARGITLVPDILANSGGVIVSYFEWVQNIQILIWDEDKVNEMLENQIAKAFIDIVQESKQSKCSLRMAAYIVALRKLMHAEEIKGVFP